MPAWLEVLVVAVASGGLAGLLVGVVAPFVQPRHHARRDAERNRERDRARHHARDRDRQGGWKRGSNDAETQAQVRAAWRAQQYERCTALLDAVSRWNTLLLTLRAWHDHPTSQSALQDPPEVELHHLPLLAATVRSFQHAVDSEPPEHTQVLLRLQAAVERFGAAALAYQQALIGPMSASGQWHVVQPSLGTTPHEEVRRRAEAYDTHRRELGLAIRAYMASLEFPDTVAPGRRQRTR